MHAAKRLLALALPALFAVSAFPATAAEDATVNVYSARKEVLIRPLLDRFTNETGIEVNLLSAGSGALLSRLQNEGRNTPADVLITVDAGNLHRARNAGVLQPVSSDTLDEAVPDALRDPEGYWYGLSQRARVIFYAKDRVEPDALKTYEDLADDRWNDRLCIRSSNNIYNQSLVASMIAHKGEEATQRWAEGLVENFARSPQGGDTDQILAVAAGECDVAVANTYYFGRLLEGDDRRAEMARQVGIVFPDQQGRGTHVNVSGAGVTKHARHPDNAVRLLEFLLRPQSQKWYAEVNNEYPVRPGVEASAILREWGAFKADELNLSKLGEYNGEAVRLMDRVGWR